MSDLINGDSFCNLVTDDFKHFVTHHGWSPFEPFSDHWLAVNINHAIENFNFFVDHLEIKTEKVEIGKMDAIGL